MINYALIVKIILLIYVNVISFKNTVDIHKLVIYNLLIIITSITIYLVNKKYSNFIIALECSISVISIYLGIPMGIYILAYLLLSYFLLNKRNNLVGIIVTFFIALIFNEKIDIINYFFISSLLYVILFSFKDYSIKICALEEKNEVQRKGIYKLAKKLHDEKEYQKQSLYSLQLEERNKLSQSMHDKIGHTIAGALMQLEAIKLVIDKDKEKSKLMINNTTKVLRKGMDDIRLTLRQIKPSSEELGLNKIKSILEEKTQETNFKYTLNYEGNLDFITSKQWIAIIESVREASTNSLKYSKGDRISIKIILLNKLIKVEIKDNGIGAMHIRRGIGLNSIEERILEIGGKLILDGSNGFSLVFLIPIENKGDNNEH